MAAGVLGAWLLAGASISAGLDRLLTVGRTPLPLGQFALEPGQFTIGSRRWWLGPELRVAQDPHHRVTLSSAAGSFTFGPTVACTLGSAGACFDFIADPGDEIVFSKSRSWLAWPTPFQVSIMGAARTSWRRHAYYHMIWKKRSGATIELVWRDQQGFFAGVGWTDGNLQVAPLVTISPSPFEAVVVSYLLQTKGWTHGTLIMVCLVLLTACQKAETRHSASLDRASLMLLPFPTWQATGPGQVQQVDLSATADAKSKADAVAQRAALTPTYVVRLDDSVQRIGHTAQCPGRAKQR